MYLILKFVSNVYIWEIRNLIYNCIVTGWREKHDIWLNIKSDIKRFAFIEMLSAEQITGGVALSKQQLDAMLEYAKTGVLNPIVKGPNKSSAKNASKMELCVGKKVDIQDKYKSNDKDVVTKKWRPGEIVDIHDCHVHVHYIGWGDEWDEVIDISVEGYRIQEGGTKIIPRGTSRDTYKRQIVAASPIAKQYKKGEFKEQEKVEQPRRRSLGSVNNNEGIENNANNLDAFVSEELARKRERVAHGDRNATMSNDRVSSSTTKRGLSRNRSFPPLSYDEDRNDVQMMYTLYEKEEKEFYAALQLEKVFVRALNDQKMHVVEVDGDGNCLFRAVAHQIWLDEDRHFELRKLCVAHMKKNAKRYSAFYDGDFKKYLIGMSKLGTWGDDIEIRALEEITDRLIYIYSSQSPNVEPLKTNFDEVILMKGVAPIKISYHGKNHYNSIFDENACLPLNMRSTRTLSTVRHQQLMG